jgi:malonyl-CoA O-methyltransferase
MMFAQHKERVRRAFSDAQDYDAHATVQRLSAQWLTDRINVMRLPMTASIAEVGCGTGILSDMISRQIPFKRFLATDISDDMVERARKKLGHDDRFAFAIVDGERPQPLGAPGTFDLICSNLAAQWFFDFPNSVRRLLELIKPGGCLLLSTLAADSFHEWRTVHERFGLESGTSRYPSLGDLACWPMGNVVRKIDIVPHVERFSSGTRFLRSLKAIGAHTPAATYRPLNVGQMRQILGEFEKRPEVTYNIAICEFRNLGS